MTSICSLSLTSISCCKFDNTRLTMDASGSAQNGPTQAKRRRTQRSPSPPQYTLDDDDSYEPYIPVAQRRQAKLAKLTSWGASGDKPDAQKQQEQEREDEEREEERQREKARKERTLLMEAQEVHDRKAAEGTSLYADIRGGC